MEIQEFNHQDFDVIIDVRSPSEFSHSHIPNAINLPVLSDAEHQYIGTLYHHHSIHAKFIGASMACKNIAALLEQYQHLGLSHHQKILIYCARGGKRSEALYTVLKSLHLRVFRLQQGYKGYRNLVLERLKQPWRFITLCGPTGCGKSEILQACDAFSIDLESLAHHYGSSFGSQATLKFGKQPSQKMFENKLDFSLSQKQEHMPLLIEAESKKLGDLIIPKALYENYQQGIFVLIKAPMQQRIERITKLYANMPSHIFFTAMQKIKPYLSNTIYQNLLHLWELQQLEEIASILIQKYYDRVYKIPKYHYEIQHTNLQDTLQFLQDLRKHYAPIS